MSGKEEADAFDSGDYVALHQSTLRKVDVIANIAARTCDRSLKTDSSWWAVNGGSVRAASAYVTEHPVFPLLAGVASIVGVVLIFVV